MQLSLEAAAHRRRAHRSLFDLETMVEALGLTGPAQRRRLRAARLAATDAANPHSTAMSGWIMITSYQHDSQRSAWPTTHDHELPPPSRQPALPPTMIETILTRTLGLDIPVVQGWMQWVGLPKLVAAVSNAAGLGVLTALTQPSPDALRRAIRDTRQLINPAVAEQRKLYGPFAVNITLLPSINPPDYEGYTRAALDEAPNAYKWGDSCYIGLGFLSFVTIILVEIFGSPAMRNASIVLGLHLPLVVAGPLGYISGASIKSAKPITFLWTTTFKLRASVSIGPLSCPLSPSTTRS
ncbi:hypothetical protein V8E36_000362 [Tilletia maclaganii]